MKMLKRYRLLVAAALVACYAGALLCTGGCGTTAGIAAGGGNTESKPVTPEPGAKVVIPDRRLAGNIVIIGTNSAMAGDLLKVQVQVRSREGGMVPMQYRFYWFDAEGKIIAPKSVAWQPLILFDRETLTMDGVAPDPKVRDYKLIIRVPDADCCL